MREEDLESRIARVARIGRGRAFSAARFGRALESVPGITRTELLHRLLTEWTGLRVAREQVAAIWDRILETHGALRRCLGEAVSLQTVLLHELHTRRGLMREPRLLTDQDLAALRVNAMTDPLTGLYNRRFLMDHLKRELSLAERTGGVVSLLLMDLRGFKGINDRLGHPVGDSVLVRTAKVIRDSLRVVDAGCRYGGDEFVAVLPNTDLVHGLAVAERIRARVAGIRLPLRIGLRPGLRYGVATYPTDARTPEFLIKVSDVRLYDSKRGESHDGPGKRRFPRFSVKEISLRLAGVRSRPSVTEVKDIGFGGLSFGYGAPEIPPVLEGEVVQRYSSDSHRVVMRPVSVVPQTGGEFRVGCAFLN
jgi:diguanylate cyclase (GGDEF)-like protein